MATTTAAVKAVRAPTQTGDIVARWVVTAFAASLLALAVLLIYELVIGSAEARAKLGIWHFLFSSKWNPVTEDFGASPFVYGTVVTSVLALLISVPLGLGAAIFLSELAPAGVSNALTFVIELLAAIPSVIYGLLAIFTLVPLMRLYIEPFLKHTLGYLPLFQGTVYGVGFLTAGLVLAIMTVPFIISVSRESLLAVPRDQREAALALGATKWETTWQIVVPYAKLGILGSVFLGLARALGETMAVTMVIGNSYKLTASLFSPGSTIASTIASQFSEASAGVSVGSLIYLALILFGVTLLVNVIARTLVWRMTSMKAAKK